MKELSVEEKAKLYDEAKARMSRAYNDNRCTIGFMNEIFPELKESENERVRNKLIEFFKGYSPDEEWWGNITQEDILAWLEKQGEQKPTNNIEPKFKIGYTMRTLQEANDGYTDGMPVVVSIDEEYYHCNNELIAIKDQDDYEYPPMNRRQKPAEWSDEDEEMLRRCISATFDHGYLKECDWLKSLKERVQPKQVWRQDNVEELTEFENVMMHVGSSFFGENAGLDPNDTNAIKEQANILLELVSKQEWSEENDDEAWLNDIICKVESDCILNKNEKDWLKSLKDRVLPQPKQEWSEEDENHVKSILSTLEYCKVQFQPAVESYNADIDWLKSLRPQSQWKPSDVQINELHKAIVTTGFNPNVLESLYNDLKNLKQ